MLNDIFMFFEQFYFWLAFSRSMYCKHCCIGCIYYEQCREEKKAEDERINELLDFSKGFYYANENIDMIDYEPDKFIDFEIDDFSQDDCNYFENGMDLAFIDEV